jgi:ribosomal protein S27AE
VTSATLIRPPEPLATSGAADPARTYSCLRCGHVMRVSGIGRHRLYFELEADSGDAVMDRVCPACGEGLPGKSVP